MTTGKYLDEDDPYPYEDPQRDGPEKVAGGGRGRLSRLGRVLNSLLTVLLVLAVLAAGALFLFQQSFEDPGPLAEERAFIVQPGNGVSAIAENLERQGMIADSRIFILGVLLRGDKSRLRAGEYLVPARASMRQIADTLVSGKSIQHRLAVPEGMTSQQVVERVRANQLLVGEITRLPAEGTLLPDTYTFLRGLERQELIDRMQRAQKRVLERLWPRRQKGLPFSTAEEALILASIVEKETAVPEERPEVAAVFINRLRRGMRLQSDPTIIYGIAGGAGTLGRPILKSEIEEKTDYNTYQIDGLPPTPIANPGREAIEAVLNPAQTKDLYFVADGTGGHAFAGSLAEHRRNVSRWRRIERERRREAAARAEADEDAAAEDEATPLRADRFQPPAPPEPPSLDNEPEPVVAATAPTEAAQQDTDKPIGEGDVASNLRPSAAADPAAAAQEVAAPTEVASGDAAGAPLGDVAPTGENSGAPAAPSYVPSPDGPKLASGDPVPLPRPRPQASPSGPAGAGAQRGAASSAPAQGGGNS